VRASPPEARTIFRCFSPRIAPPTIQITANFGNLTSPDIAAHIHCCEPPGTNALVATTIPTFAGFPLGVTSGTYASTFGLTQPLFYDPAFVTAQGGTIPRGFLFAVAYVNDALDLVRLREVSGLRCTPSLAIRFAVDGKQRIACAADMTLVLREALR
jgi:hypothetical protein